MLINRKSFLLAAAATALLPAQESFARTRPVTMLPRTSGPKRFAWTVDDGVSNLAVKSYLDIAEKYDQHITFFVTSRYSSWTKNASQIKDLLAQGKIQLANHTYSHKDLMKSTDGVIKDELRRCHDFLMNHFYYDAKPYFRATYGNWDQRVIDVAASLGYTVPVQWNGTLGDVGGLKEGQVLDLANQWFHMNHIVVDHANSVKSNDELLRLVGLIKQRELESITLREAFGKNFR